MPTAFQSAPQSAAPPADDRAGGLQTLQASSGSTLQASSGSLAISLTYHFTSNTSRPLHQTHSLPTHARSTSSSIGRSSSPLRSAVRSAAQRWDIRSASGVPAAS